MTRAFLIGVFLCSSLVAGIASEGDYKLLDSTTEKAVLVPGTQTRGGQYALAWMVLLKGNAEPVDWSMLNTGEFEKRYLDEDYLVDAQYEPANLVVDLRAKKVIGKIAQGRSELFSAPSQLCGLYFVRLRLFVNRQPVLAHKMMCQRP